MFALLSLLFTAGAVVLILLTLLAGAINSSATNQIYFLQADTSGIAHAPPTSRWTFWNYCSSDSSSAVGLCNGVHPAYPLDPPSGRTFGTTDGVPPQFIGTMKFFYLTRFMFAFVLIALFFAVCSLLTGLAALCTRMGAYISGFLNMIGLFFQMLTATLMTYDIFPLLPSKFPANSTIVVLHMSKAGTHSARTVATPQSENTHSASCGQHLPVSSSQPSSFALLDRAIAVTGIQPPVIPRNEASLVGGAGAQEAEGA